VSIIDLDKLTPQALVAQFVIECRGQGTFLQYDDYQIIDEWVSSTPDTDTLLLILSEVLPEYFLARNGVRAKARSLKAARKKVLSRIRK